MYTFLRRINEMLLFMFTDIQRFPFDSNNPIGYLVAVLVEYIIYGYEYLILSCTLGLAIGGFWLSIQTTKEIQRLLRLINDKAQTNKIQSNEFKALFAEYVHGSGTVKQLSITHSFSCTTA